MFTKIATTCCTFFLLFQAVICSKFAYSETGQRSWSRHNGDCKGEHQSPINIYHFKAHTLHMPAIDMIGYRNLLPYPITMTNNGHTVALGIPKVPANGSIGPVEFMPYILGGKLPGQFELESLHFHWGYKNNRGAEHVINDIRHAMEMHLVHRNKKYANLAEALQHDDGVTVLGFFYDLSEKEHHGITAVARHLHLIEEPAQTITLNVTFTLSALIENVNLDRFYTYKGSLTTPPCSEAVTWVLFPDPIPITLKQLSRFRQLTDDMESALADNFRNLQPLGNRRIFQRSVGTQHTLVEHLPKEPDYQNIDWTFNPYEVHH